MRGERVTAVAALLLAAGHAAPCAGGGRVSGGELEENLRVHVYRLADRIGERNAGHYPQLLKARDYIAETFSEVGVPARLQEYTVWNSTFHNVVATLPGSGGKEAGALILGAHYDSAEGTPGADDNASGTAGLLELARLLKGEALRKTVVFAAFSTEEPPYFGTDLMGSRFYAAEAARSGARIEGMICLEMIGYYRREKGSQHYPAFLKFFFPDRGDFIALVGNFRSRGLLNRVRERLQTHMQVPIEHASLPAFVPGVDWSDHRSFWQEGIPAVMLTDTALYRNDNYHQHTDTYDTLDYRTMAEIVSGLAETIKDMAR